jgi:hypothetical protein
MLLRPCALALLATAAACEPARAPASSEPPRELPALLVSAAAPADDVVLRGPLAAAARDCYQKAQARDPKAEGSVALTLGIGPSGKVLSVEPHARGLDPIAVECVRHAAAVEIFSPPATQPATISTTYDFPRAGTDYAVLVQRAREPLGGCAAATTGGAHGQLVLLVTITPDGKVRAVDVRSYEGLTRDTAACGARAVGAVPFVAQPDERSAIVTIDFE